MRGFFYSIYFAILGRPLKFVLRYGPRVNFGLLDVGFYSGKSSYEICAEISGVPSLHWSFDPAACESMIQQRIDSWAVLVGGIIYLFIVLKTLFAIATRLPWAGLQIVQVIHQFLEFSASSRCLPASAFEDESAIQKEEANAAVSG